MDSEKHTHMRELLEADRPVTDEGPFYHHAWWESYKGSVKGKLGGGLLGAVIGSVAGTAAVAGLGVASIALPVAAPVIVAGFAAAGLMYGVHEFAEVGKITGAVASSQKLAEKRMRAYEDSRFDELKEEINEVKSLVKGEQPANKTAAEKVKDVRESQADYRTEHFQGSKVDGAEKLVFWKIALVGLVVGAAAGAVLASGGLAGEILHAVGLSMGGEAGVVTIADYLTSMVAMGAIGASFGINRDIFRQIFDQTDLWFRGFVSHDHARTVLLEGQTQEVAQEKAAEPPKERVVYTPTVQYPSSETHHRDKLLAEAKKVLAHMDTSQMARH